MYYWEGRSWLPVEWTPPTLVSISYSPSPLSVTLCSMSVHRSVQDLEFYGLISRLMPILNTRGILGRVVVSCPSNAQTQLRCLSAPHHNLCLLNFVALGCIDPFKSFIFLHTQQASAHIIHKRHTWEGLSRLSVECTPQLWCLSAPLQHLCLLKFVPWVCIDPFEI